jgi:hypothetical protein
MKFSQLQHRVARAEELVEGRKAQVRDHAGRLVDSWRGGWTPWRIVIAGLSAGFLTGRAEPVRAIGGLNPTRWLQLASTASGLFSSLQAAVAASRADTAADKADDAAESADDAATSTHRAAHATRQAASATQEQVADPHPTTGYAAATDAGETEPWVVRAPRPAEAATDVSER